MKRTFTILTLLLLATSTNLVIAGKGKNKGHGAAKRFRAIVVPSKFDSLTRRSASPTKGWNTPSPKAAKAELQRSKAARRRYSK
ncbi:hypothetical protein HN446_00300 [bacterium]|jgi:hypothetical protein|nr:hypothetical protein [bacterium]